VTWTVGFDLDMTLVDSREGIIATMQTAIGQQGVTADREDLWQLLGHPLDHTLGHWLPENQIEQAVATYRQEYLVHAVPITTPLPGAHEAFATVRDLGGRVVVVSAKVAPAVRAVLEHVGLAPDDVVGELFGEAKGTALREHHAGIYVGDHAGDVHGARVAGATSVVVLTGPNDRETLERAGADVILSDLTEFPGWLRAHRAGATA
jgi:phosphoglycolate phosphatase